MALKGFPNLKIELDDNTGAALQDISAYVTTINGYTPEQILEEITAAGDADERWAVVGFNRLEPIVLTGPYDNTADGLWDVTRDTPATARRIKFTFDMPGAADTKQIATFIRSQKIGMERASLHAVEVTLQPTGAVT